MCVDLLGPLWSGYGPGILHQQAGFLLDLNSSKKVKAYYYGALGPEIHFLGIYPPTLNLLWFLRKVQTYVCLTSAIVHGESQKIKSGIQGV